MLKYLRIGKQETPTGPDPIELSRRRLATAPDLPIALRSLNDLDQNIKQRIYRSLIPHQILSRFDIDPITWEGPGKTARVSFKAEPGSSKIYLEARSPFDPVDPIFVLEIEDNRFNRLDLNLIVLSDPERQRFDTDVDDEGRSTLFGTVHRNLAAEEQAMTSGLAPGQTRPGLRGSAAVFDQLETFLIALGHRSINLEPLTYASAWVFERRGFAYVQGHKLMDEINEAFQPGGALHLALDGSTPFRQPQQWNSVRGRAWAIHDGILQVLDKHWDGLRMVKQIGRHANVNTFPGGEY
ncbi:MAG: hypothetical protein PVH18_09335 [Chloroflexota bacterium]|jgi:hypothetical protein